MNIHFLFGVNYNMEKPSVNDSLTAQNDNNTNMTLAIVGVVTIMTLAYCWCCHQQYQIANNTNVMHLIIPDAIQATCPGSTVHHIFPVPFQFLECQLQKYFLFLSISEEIPLSRFHKYLFEIE